MGQVIGWLVVLALFGLMIWALAKENKRQRNRSAQEYEEDIVNARESMMRAGMMELGKFVGEAKGKQAAVEFLKDQEQGQTKTGSKGDDAERTQSAEQNSGGEK